MIGHSCFPCGTKEVSAPECKAPSLHPQLLQPGTGLLPTESSHIPWDSSGTSRSEGEHPHHELSHTRVRGEGFLKSSRTGDLPQENQPCPGLQRPGKKQQWPLWKKQLIPSLPSTESCGVLLESGRCDHRAPGKLLCPSARPAQLCCLLRSIPEGSPLQLLRCPTAREQIHARGNSELRSRVSAAHQEGGARFGPRSCRVWHKRTLPCAFSQRCPASLEALLEARG